MRSAITEAKTILQDAGGRSRTRNVPIEDVNEWGQITERWENAWQGYGRRERNHWEQVVIDPLGAVSSAASGGEW